MRHIPGLDAIRLVCALIVALGHFAPDLATNLRLLGPLAEPVASVIRILFNGPAAVIMFFVLSGFVIHRPYAQGKPFAPAEYYARRYLRIVPPTIAAGLIYLAIGAGPPNGDWNETVLWSVFCELAYYTLYPLLLWSGVRIGVLTVAAYAVAFGLVLAFPEVAHRLDANYPAFGHWTFVIGLPCWLSGCWLAAQQDRARPAGAAEIWAWRAAIYGAAVLLLFAKFHMKWAGPLAVYSFSLNLLAPFATLWIAREVAFWQARATKPEPWLDRPGRASFSVYLLHPVALILTHRLTADRGAAGLALFLLLVTAVAGGFYWLIERPSHRLAQRIGRAARKPI